MENSQLKLLDNESTNLVDKAKAQKVKNQVQYDFAGALLKACMAHKVKVESVFNPAIEGFKRTKAEAEKNRKSQVLLRDEHTSIVSEAILILRWKCKDHEDEQAQLRLIEEQKKQEEADKKAKEEKERLEKLAENEKEWGDDEKAEEITQASKNVEVEVEEVKPTIAKTAGLGIRRTFQWKIIDENKIPREYLKVDEVKINKAVRELKDKTNIEGIEVYYE